MKNVQPDSDDASISSPAQTQEVSLLEIWRILSRRRKLFFKTAISVVVAGLVLALVLPKAYDLNTSLEIAAIPTSDGLTPLEAPETVKAKLENTFVPRVINEFKANTDSRDRYRVMVRIPKKSEVVLLRSRTSMDDVDIYRKLHRDIVAAVANNHRKLVDSQKRKIQTALAQARITLEELRDPTTLEALVKPQEKILRELQADLSALADPNIFGVELKAAENRIQEARNELAAIKDRAATLNHQIENLDVHKELVKKQITELEAQTNATRTMHENLAEGAGNDAVTASLLLADKDKLENQKLLAELRELLYVKLENDKIRLHSQLEQNLRKQAVQEQRVLVAQAKLQKLKDQNALDQDKLKASIAEINAGIAKLKSDQKRLISNQEQLVAEIQSQLDNFIETGAVAAPTLSSEPTSIPRWVILLAALFLAMVLGIGMVFIEEMREKAMRA